MDSKPEQQYSTYCYLTSFIWTQIVAKIRKKNGRELVGWSRPRIFSDGRSYKINWYEPQENGTEDYLTLYDDGTWQLYQSDGFVIEGKVDPPHSRRYVTRLTKTGVLGIHAFGAVKYFKQLKK